MCCSIWQSGSQYPYIYLLQIYLILMYFYGVNKLLLLLGLPNTLLVNGVLSIVLRRMEEDRKILIWAEITENDTKITKASML